MERAYLHEQEKNLALFTAIYINSKIDPKKNEPTQPDKYYLHKPQRRFYVESDVAKTIFDLIKECAIPEWLVYCIPRDEIRPFVKGRRSVSPRLWLSVENESLALFAPGDPNEEGEIVVGMGLVMDGFYGVCAVKDIDTDQIHLISVPRQEEENVCIYQLKILAV